MADRIEVSVREDAITIGLLNWRSLKALNKVLLAVTEGIPEHKEKILGLFSREENKPKGVMAIGSVEAGKGDSEADQIMTGLEMILAIPSVADVCFEPLSLFLKTATTLNEEEIESLDVNDLKKIFSSLIQQNKKVFPQIDGILKNVRRRQEVETAKVA